MGNDGGRIDIFLHVNSVSVDNKLDQIITQLKTVIQQGAKMDTDIQAIIDQAKANTNAEQAAIGALNALFQKFIDLVNSTASISPADRAALQAEVADMKSSASAVAAAIVADTPTTAPAPAPTITAISLASGPAAGGTLVTLTGSGFQPGAHGSLVDIGGARATVSTVSADGNSLVAVTGAGAVGPADVVVTNGDGQKATLTAGYTYQ
jgi:ABC-type transporter Mla subunit MlaD